MSDIGNKEIFARNLAFYIERSGKTQKELSLEWDIPTSTINNWVMAKKYPRMDKVEMLADYFGILKSDLIEEPMPISIPYGAETVLRISALEPEGVQKVLEAVDQQLDKMDTVVEILLPYSQGGLSSNLHQGGQILEEEYRDDGIYMKARLKDRYLQMVEKYRI